MINFANNQLPAFHIILQMIHINAVSMYHTAFCKHTCNVCFSIAGRVFHQISFRSSALYHDIRTIRKSVDRCVTFRVGNQGVNIAACTIAKSPGKSAFCNCYRIRSSSALSTNQLSVIIHGRF